MGVDDLKLIIRCAIGGESPFMMCLQILQTQVIQTILRQTPDRVGGCAVRVDLRILPLFEILGIRNGIFPFS